MITTLPDILSAYFNGQQVKPKGKRKYRKVRYASLSTLRGGGLNLEFEDGTRHTVGWKEEVEFKEQKIV